MAPTGADAPRALPPLDPGAMAHFIAIQSALTPAEAALGAAGRRRAVAAPSCARGSTSCRRCRVPDAVAKIRSFIGATSRRRCVVIGLPFNDLRCLGSITRLSPSWSRTTIRCSPRSREARDDARPRAWIRTLPQRDDDGEAKDGPKVEACEPPQRLRIPADDPNCVERAALYLAVAELIDPEPVRQLATLDTPVGLHTFPVENGAPVILDPQVPRNCLDCGIALDAQGPVEIEPHDAIDWTADLAERATRARFATAPPACAARAMR